jgi:putative transposase
MEKKRFGEEQTLRLFATRKRAISPLAMFAVLTANIAENTFYLWRQKYGGLQVPEVRRLRELEQENNRLKRLLAERCLEVDAMRDVISKNC